MVTKQGHALKEGDRARAIGNLAPDNDPECFIEATVADAMGTGSVAPFAMPNRSIGGGSKGLQGGVWGWSTILDDSGKPARVWGQMKGLNNIGCLSARMAK